MIKKSVGAVMLTLLVATTLSACSKGGVSSESSTKNGQQPVNQSFGKSYVKQIPENTVRQKEVEMTSPESEKKGPAVGEYNPSNPEKNEKQHQE